MKTRVAEYGPAFRFWLWRVILFAIGVLLLPVLLIVMIRPDRTNAVPEDYFPVATTRYINLDDPSLEWSEGWKVERNAATPPEPADPMTMPAGTVRFSYQGDELSLEVKPGDYWAYLYVTVDGEPANMLPPSTLHDPAPNPVAGYLPLYKPEAQDRWGESVVVHRSGDPANTHDVEVTVWRGWGETPLLGIVVDDGYPPRGRGGPETALLILILFCMAPAIWSMAKLLARSPERLESVRRLSQAVLGERNQRFMMVAGAIGFLIAIVGVWLESPWFSWGGLALLGLASLVRPVFWYAALFFALPFYYSFALPLPGRAINLVDVGIWGGLAIVSANTLVVVWSGRGERTRVAWWALTLLTAIALWSAVSTAQSDQVDIAIREWRTVFVAAAVLAVGLMALFHYSDDAHREVGWLVGGWLAGATLFAGLGLLLYPREQVIIAAEGVQRLRGFYGSPNNLALYLERTLAVSLALALFAGRGRLRIAALAAALVQGAAFLLTFSKGGLFVALPAMGIALWGAGFYTLHRQGRSTRILWALAGAAALVVLAIVPFLGTERFASIIDLASGTGFLRVNLWRAAWQMALDHSLLGVGPDGFLYAYRSQYIFPQAWMEPNLNHPHNWLLDWWTRLGIPGLLLGVAFWSLLVWNLLRNLRRGGASLEWGALQVGLFAATTAALAHGLVDLSYALPDLMAVWALMAMIVCIRPAETNS